MTVVLARVDDRLIHGQVTVGWNDHLRPDEIVLADNAIAADPWQSRVYASSVPPSIVVSVLNIPRAASHLMELAGVDRRTILLTSTVGQMAELVRVGAPIVSVNIGGLHFGPGKKEMLPFVFVDHQDLVAMTRLIDLGVDLVAQQVPGGMDHPLNPNLIAEMESRFA